MINYKNIANAIDHYGESYQEIEVSWTISKLFQLVTLPKTAPLDCIVSSSLGDLVGSAEQSFIAMVYSENLSGKYLATTPCFRNEKTDDLHCKYFMKTELFDNLDLDLKGMVAQATSFFQSFGISVKEVSTEDGVDLVDTKFGIELGSYGKRLHPLVGWWVYGTGCAEPRLSTVIERWRL